MLTAEQLHDLRASQAEPNRLAKAMELAGLTQVQVAEKTRLTQPYISAILNGKANKLPVPTAHRLAQLFGCTIDDLFPARDRMEVA